MSKNKISRKDFLSYSALLGVTSMVGSSTLLSSCGGAKGPVYTPLKQAGEYYIPELPDKAIDGKELKAGVIGCGGRGSGAIVDLLTAANGIKVTALGDTFADRLEGLRKNLKEQHNQDVPAENCFKRSYRNLAKDIRTFYFYIRIRFYFNCQIQIAILTAVETGVALSLNTKFCAAFNICRDLNF